VIRILHASLLVFVFLFAQAGLSAHAAGHVSLNTHKSDKGMPADVACEFCVGYAQLVGNVPMPDQPIVPINVARLRVQSACSTISRTQAFFYSRPRAPPAFS